MERYRTANETNPCRDGHVEHQILKRFFLDLDEAALRRWNHDNLLHYSQ